MAKLLALLLGCALAASAQIYPFPGPGTAAPHSGGGAGSFTLLHTSPSSFPSTCTGSTCSITLSSAITANDLAVVSCTIGAFYSMQSISAGGTLVPVASASGAGNSNAGWTSWGYIYPTSATSGPLTVTFSGPIGGTTGGCALREYSVSAGTPKLDWAAAVLKSGTTTVAGETPAFSGSKDGVIQSIATDYSAMTGVSGYGNGVFDSTDGLGYADLLNTTSTTPPTWTGLTGSGNAEVGGLAFATDATPCSDVLYQDWSNSSSGTTATPALANAGSHGLPITGSSTYQSNGWLGSASPLTGMSYQSATPPALHHSIRTCDGSSHSGSTTFAMQYDFSKPTAVYLLYAIPTGGAVNSYGEYISTTFSATDTVGHDVSGVGDAGNNNFVTLQVIGTGTSTALLAECNGGGSPGTVSATIDISDSTWYWVTLQNNSETGGQIEVCTDSSCGTVVGSGACTADGWTVANANTFQIGQGGARADTPSTVFTQGTVIFNPHGTFPVVTQ